MGHYLKEGQTFESVIRQDAEILRKAGVTHQQVGDALEKVLKSFNWHKEHKLKFSRDTTQRVNDTLSVNAVQYKGFEVCPYDKSLTASIDFFVNGIPNGNKAGRSADDPTMVTEMMPNLIRKLQFFEGDVPYGIRPEWAIQVYEIVESEGANIWVPQKKLVYETESYTGDVSRDFCGSFGFRKNPDRTIQIAPGATLYMKGEEGVIFADREFQITPEMQIDGLPLESHSGEVWEGQTFINKDDKVVG